MASTLVVLTTSIVALISGFMLGVYSIKGYLISPELSRESRANYEDPVDSDETDIDEDATVLDHAPNWANGEEADRKQGLRMRKGDSKKTKTKQLVGSEEASKGPSVEDTGEECKLVLVVRTDLGMTKGEYTLLFSFSHFVRDDFFFLTTLLTDSYRQNRSTMFPRNIGLLQNHLPPGPQGRPRQLCRQNTLTLGTFWSSQGRRASQVPGRAGGVDGQSTKPGHHRRGDPGRREDAD